MKKLFVANVVAAFPAVVLLALGILTLPLNVVYSEPSEGGNAFEQYSGILAESLSAARSADSSVRVYAWSSVRGILELLQATKAAIPEETALQIEKLAISGDSQDSVQTLFHLYRLAPALRSTRLAETTEDAKLKTTYLSGKQLQLYTAVLAEISAGATTNARASASQPKTAQNYVQRLLSEKDPSKYEPAALENIRKALGLNQPMPKTQPALAGRYLYALLLSRNEALAQVILKKSSRHWKSSLEDIVFECSSNRSKDSFVRLMNDLCSSVANEIRSTQFEKIKVEHILGEVGAGQLNGKIDGDLENKAIEAQKKGGHYSFIAEHQVDTTHFMVAPSDHWFAVLSGDAVTCLSGCLSIEPAANELGTYWSFKWSIFSVLPRANNQTQVVLSERIDRQGFPVAVDPKARAPEGTTSLFGRVQMPPDVPPHFYELTGNSAGFTTLPLLDFGAGVNAITITEITRGPISPEEQRMHDSGLSNLHPKVTRTTPSIQRAQREAHAKLRELVAKRSQEVPRKAFPGVLSYAFSLQKALNDKDWLAPSLKEGSSQIEVVALRSLARLHLLRETSLIPAEEFAVPESEGAPWKQRQALLRQSIPLIAIDLYQWLAPELMRKVVLLSDNIKKVSKVFDDTSKAMQSLDQLSNDETFALLERSSETLEIVKPQVKLQKEQLLVSLTGALIRLRELVALQKMQLSMACDALKRFQYSGTQLLPKLEPEQQVMSLCPSQE